MLPRSLLPVLALAGSSYAASGTSLGLSASCQTSVVNLLGSDFGTCADIIGLAGLFASSGSVVPTLNSWLGSVCTQDCSPAALANASSIIGAGCASDIAAGASVAVGLEVIMQNYTTFRDTLCLEKVDNATTKSSSPEYCISDLLTSVQDSTNSTLNSTTILGFATGGTSGLLSLFSSVPASVVCSDCTHAIFTKIAPLIGDYAALGGAVLNNECKGANFTDGEIPAGVKEASAAVATAAGTTGQAAAATSGAGAGVGLARGAWGVVGVVGAAVAGVAVLL